MPDYSAQLNQERAKDKKISIKTKLPNMIIGKMTEAIENGESWVWIVAFMIAGLNDLLDCGIVGSVPIIGDFIDVACTIILTGILWNIGGMIKWKVRFAIWIAGFIETTLGLLIIPEFLPFWIISILYAHHKVKERASLAEEGIREYKRGRINRGIITEFK